MVIFDLARLISASFILSKRLKALLNPSNFISEVGPLYLFIDLSELIVFCLIQLFLQAFLLHVNPVFLFVLKSMCYLYLLFYCFDLSLIFNYFNLFFSLIFKCLSLFFNYFCLFFKGFFQRRIIKLCLFGYLLFIKR